MRKITFENWFQNQNGGVVLSVCVDERVLQLVRFIVFEKRNVVVAETVFKTKRVIELGNIYVVHHHPRRLLLHHHHRHRIQTIIQIKLKTITTTTTMMITMMKKMITMMTKMVMMMMMMNRRMVAVVMHQAIIQMQKAKVTNCLKF